MYATLAIDLVRVLIFANIYEFYIELLGRIALRECKMRSFATVVAWSVCLSVGHNHESCKNG